MGKMKEEFMRLQETPVMDDCPQCNGAGEVDADYHMSHNTNRDVGFIDTRVEECDMCNGSGEMERLCNCGEWITLIRGEGSYVCEECADE